MTKGIQFFTLSLLASIICTGLITGFRFKPISFQLVGDGQYGEQLFINLPSHFVVIGLLLVFYLGKKLYQSFGEKAK